MVSVASLQRATLREPVVSASDGDGTVVDEDSGFVVFLLRTCASAGRRGASPPNSSIDRKARFGALADDVVSPLYILYTYRAMFVKHVANEANCSRSKGLERK
jgi:hypothetical protein